MLLPLIPVLAVAQAPFSVTMQIGPSQIYDPVGTASGSGLDVAWNVGDSSAVATLSGTPTAGGTSFVLQWSNLLSLPIAVNVLAQQAGSYTVHVNFATPADGEILWSYSDQTTDFAFGQDFGALNMLNILVNLDDVGLDYDMSVDIQWGPGTPVETTTFSSVKRLFG
jgi:hypothetical protein